MVAKLIYTTPHPEREGVANDPNCGNCGKPLSAHYRGREIFCFTHTNGGDIFTDEPLEELIVARMVERHPEIYEVLVDEWKRENGHL